MNSLESFPKLLKTKRSIKLRFRNSQLSSQYILSKKV